MAGSKTDLLETEVLRLMTGQALATLSFPITPYLALFTVVPTDAAASGTEVSGSGYARQSASGKFAVPSSPGGTTALNANVDFPTVTGSSYTVVGFAVFDAVSAGNMLYWADTASTLVAVGNFFRLPSGTGITITEA